MREVEPSLLAEIRRAAFDLRAGDPQEAVRVLRRAAAGGGDAEVLARGALGEIYLEELGDLDGAEHEYRTVLKLAPGLAAAEIGLSRVLREQGRQADAVAALDRAIESLAGDASSFRESQPGGEPLPAGAEEVVLTLLESAADRARLAKGPDDSTAALPPDVLGRIEDVARWAARERLFDALREEEDDPSEDWVRFHSLQARLLGSAGRSGDAAEALARAEADGQLPAAAAARLRRDALEDAGDLRGAAEQARRALDSGTPEPLDTLRAAALTAAAGDEPGAAGILRSALSAAESRLGSAPADEQVALQDSIRRYRDALAPEPGALVGLGVRR